MKIARFKINKFVVSIVFGLSILLGSLSPAVVWGEEGSGSEGLTAPPEITQVETEVEHVAEVEHNGKKHASEKREQAKSHVSELKKTAEKQTKEVRSKSCEARKTEITNRLENKAASSQKHKETFDAILAKVDEFAKKKNLNVESADTLKADVDVAASKVEEEVATLKALKGAVDCNDVDTVAANLDAFKSQMVVVRESLKDYRGTIRAYMQAVKKSAKTVEDAAKEPDTTEERI